MYKTAVTCTCATALKSAPAWGPGFLAGRLRPTAAPDNLQHAHLVVVQRIGVGSIYTLRELLLMRQTAVTSTQHKHALHLPCPPVAQALRVQRTVTCEHPEVRCQCFTLHLFSCLHGRCRGSYVQSNKENLPVHSLPPVLTEGGTADFPLHCLQLSCKIKYM